MTLGFLGQFDQKIDKMGRMSVPAALRRELEQGDPAWPSSQSTRLVLMFGEHLNGKFQAYSVRAMTEITQKIFALPRSSMQRKAASRMILSNSMEIEVDGDGRMTLPLERREQLGLGKSAGAILKLVGMGDHFEISVQDSDLARAPDDVDAFISEQGANFDPMSFID